MGFNYNCLLVILFCCLMATSIHDYGLKPFDVDLSDWVSTAILAGMAMCIYNLYRLYKYTKEKFIEWKTIQNT